ncbi:unnamed protein product [Cyprideis torosa]|uniref:Uncharacterized protein n=1 Tax=Cyprideis torosa TaxID=163714 RepID=A0A7R8ZMQ6_9CRUS|nr:unnamed protein product [Cyprideis torosa]CAG0889593.1 unnamed protein product [Cyprideis torosa]
MSPAVVSGGLIFVSGQLGVNTEGAVVTGGIEEQTKQALENLGTVLRAANADFADVVKTTVFLKDVRDIPGMNEIYGKVFFQNRPARSAIQIAELPKKGALVEIEAIAIKESPQKSGNPRL